MIGLTRIFDLPDVRIREAVLDDSRDMAAIHAGSFGRDWSDEEFDSLLRQSTIHGFMALKRGTLRGYRPAGFVLVRVADTDSEILTIAVHGASRGAGIGRRLMEETVRFLYREGVESLHLEVDADNEVAVNLYRSLDFETVGERTAYYAQGLPESRSALVMRLQVR